MTIYQYSWNTAEVSVEDPIHTSKKCVTREEANICQVWWQLSSVRDCVNVTNADRTFFTSKQVFCSSLQHSILLLLLLNWMLRSYTIILKHCGNAIVLFLCTGQFSFIVSGSKTLVSLFRYVPIEMCEMLLFSLFIFRRIFFRFFLLLAFSFIWSYFGVSVYRHLHFCDGNEYS